MYHRNQLEPLRTRHVLDIVELVEDREVHRATKIP